VPDAIYPQFATHNAHTLSAIYQIAGQNYYPGQYEFQCLHGMGEPLYDQVVGPVADGKLNRPCRIYAPVGTHETLLAYLVRRLLENGANTSFVNRIADETIALDELVADPVAVVEPCTRPRACLACRIRASRCRARCMASRAPIRPASTCRTNIGWRRCRPHCWPAPATPRAEPLLGAAVAGTDATSEPVLNPADRRDVVGRSARQRRLRSKPRLWPPSTWRRSGRPRRPKCAPPRWNAPPI
jgi:RHH-type proline utilization regulon transcriptional repressor/proline dehydrogenase/delta 1-pyrroline-5-carboxylate dehydrogenase